MRTPMKKKKLSPDQKKLTADERYKFLLNHIKCLYSLLYLHHLISADLHDGWIKSIEKEEFGE